MIRPLKTKDFNNFIIYCSKYDKYSDFYITEDNKRRYLNNKKVAKKVFNNCVKRSDKCFVYIKKNEILGILLITGFSDKFHRKYVKVLVDNHKVANHLFQYLNWQDFKNLFIKAKKYNPYIVYFNKNKKLYSPSNAVKKANFKIIGSRDKELLLKQHTLYKGK